MRRLGRRLLLLASFALGPVTGAHAQSVNLAGLMTSDYLLQCQKDQNACRETTNSMLQVLSAASALGQGKFYRGCAPVPLSPEQTALLLMRVVARPQQPMGYAAEDIAAAAEALWPCR
jgi:hypothetical protein